jgi:hypothetical protein
MCSFLRKFRRDLIWCALVAHLTIADRAGHSGAALSPVVGAVYSLGMKITRLKRGYRISLNDGEFDALSLLVQYGLEAREEQGEEFLEAASAAAKRAFNGRFALREPMEVDEDRRRSRSPGR